MAFHIWGTLRINPNFSCDGFEKSIEKLCYEHFKNLLRFNQLMKIEFSKF
jgi:hypothetical protein